MSKVTQGAAIKRMQEIAQDIYDSTPGINDEMPRQTSKILQNVKNNKKGALGGGIKMTTYELNFEDLRSKYLTIMSEYQ